MNTMERRGRARRAMMLAFCFLDIFAFQMMGMGKMIRTRLVTMFRTPMV